MKVFLLYYGFHLHGGRYLIDAAPSHTAVQWLCPLRLYDTQEKDDFQCAGTKNNAAQQGRCACTRIQLYTSQKTRPSDLGREMKTGANLSRFSPRDSRSSSKIRRYLQTSPTSCVGGHRPAHACSCLFRGFEACRTLYPEQGEENFREPRPLKKETPFSPYPTSTCA